MPWYRGACYVSADYAEAKRNVLSRVLNVLTDGAVRQFRGSEFQSLGAATEKRRAAVSKLCGRTDRSFFVDDRSERDWLYGLIRSAKVAWLLKRGHQICQCRPRYQSIMYNEERNLWLRALPVFCCTTRIACRGPNCCLPLRSSTTVPQYSQQSAIYRS